MDQSGDAASRHNETLTTAGTGWSNTGSIGINGGTLDLGNINGSAGSFTTAGLGIFAPAPAGSFSRTGGTVNLTGTLDNTGSTLALDSRTGAWNVVGGTIIGGTITTSGGNVLTAVNSSNTLSGVTLDGTLDMGSVFAPKMTVTSGLTLNGTILLGSANGSNVGTLTAQGTQAWSGTGSILFGGSDTTCPGHFQRRDADPRRGPDPARPERRDHRRPSSIRGPSTPTWPAGRPAALRTRTVTLIGTGWSNQGTLQVDTNEPRSPRPAPAGPTPAASTSTQAPRPRQYHGSAGSFTTAGLGIFARPRRARSAAPAAR